MPGEIKPCPLCEGEVNLSATYYSVIVQCTQCGAKLTYDISQDNVNDINDKIHKKWNTRKNRGKNVVKACPLCGLKSVSVTCNKSSDIYIYCSSCDFVLDNKLQQADIMNGKEIEDKFGEMLRLWNGKRN